MPNIQTGFACEVRVTSPDTIEKTSLRVYDETEARRLEHALVTYEGQLQTEPLNTARLLGTDLVPGQGGYRVRHTTELINGPTLTELRGDDYVTAFRQTIGQIAEMSTLRDGKTLVVPIDAYPPNFHVGSDGPTLIDLYPPMPRNADGTIPLENLSTRATRMLAEPHLGQKSGVIVRLLANGVVGETGRLGRVRHAMRGADDWCYDALPDNLTGHNRDVVRRQISQRFLPFIIQQGVVRRVARIGKS